MASVFHHLLAALCFADLLFLISLVIVSPVFIHILIPIPTFIVISIPIVILNLASSDNNLEVALGVSGFPLWLYHLAECFCHLGLAASVFLTIAITIERYQVNSQQISLATHKIKILKITKFSTCK